VRTSARRELLAPREDVWAFLAEPHHLADWWPGIAAVHVDRRGFARGARWSVSRAPRPSLLRRPGTSETLLVTIVEPLSRFGFELVDARVTAELTLQMRPDRRTLAELAVEGPFLIGPRRLLAQNALKRLYDLCQTAAEQ
jgi:uncharacterized protein YndB with AHSA1/START domain